MITHTLHALGETTAESKLPKSHSPSPCNYGDPYEDRTNTTTKDSTVPTVLKHTEARGKPILRGGTLTDFHRNHGKFDIRRVDAVR